MAQNLTRDNFRREIVDYLKLPRTVEFPSLPTEALELFRILKREKGKGGRYPECSIFEVANRVMSDLVVFGAAEKILFEPPPEPNIRTDELKVLLGVENGWDITAVLADGRVLLGECFNVAPSFFSSKNYWTRKALEKEKAGAKVIAFNHEARSDLKSLEKWKASGIHFLPINVTACLDRWQNYGDQS